MRRRSEETYGALLDAAARHLFDVEHRGAIGRDPSGALVQERLDALAVIEWMTAWLWHGQASVPVRKREALRAFVKAMRDVDVAPETKGARYQRAVQIVAAAHADLAEQGGRAVATSVVSELAGIDPAFAQWLDRESEVEVILKSYGGKKRNATKSFDGVVARLALPVHAFSEIGTRTLAAMTNAIAKGRASKSVYRKKRGP